MVECDRSATHAAHAARCCLLSQGDIQMHSFANATSSHFKRDNWAQLQRFCAKQGMDLPTDLVEGTIQGTHGAAVAMLEHLYEVFTGKK